MSIFYGEKEYEMRSSNLAKCKLGNVLGVKNTNHKYSVGEQVGMSKVVRQKRIRDSRNNNILAYDMLCLTSNKEYEITQFNLSYGYGSPYVSGHKAWEGNWLYKEKHLLKYFANPEDAKNIPAGSDKPIMCICPKCNEEQERKANDMVYRGFTCNYCRPSMSYPELVMTGYLKTKNINYIPQYSIRCKNSVRHLDFYLPNHNIAIETHGIQHYEDGSFNSAWKDAYINTIKSDEEKRIYCKENGIKLIEIDCRRSRYDFIINNLNKTILPKVTEDEKYNILKVVEDIRFSELEEQVLKKYLNGQSMRSIGIELNIDATTVGNIAKRHGVYKPKFKKNNTNMNDIV